jgi:ferredoxin
MYGTDDQYDIHPDECIACGACEPECPVNAIFAEDEVPSLYQQYIQRSTSSARAAGRL